MMLSMRQSATAGLLAGLLGSASALYAQTGNGKVVAGPNGVPVIVARLGRATLKSPVPQTRSHPFAAMNAAAKVRLLQVATAEAPDQAPPGGSAPGAAVTVNTGHMSEGYASLVYVRPVMASESTTMLDGQSSLVLVLARQPGIHGYLLDFQIAPHGKGTFRVAFNDGSSYATPVDFGLTGPVHVVVAATLPNDPGTGVTLTVTCDHTYDFEGVNITTL